MALPSAYRLKQRHDFNAVYQFGTKHHSPNLTLRALRQSARLGLSLPDRQTAAPRIGISISQKVSKRAVVRNRIKRKIRAALRQFLPYIAPGWRLVIVVKPSATQCDYGQFLQELKQLFVKAGIVDGH